MVGPGNGFLVFIWVKLSAELGREQSRVSLLVGLRLLELSIGAVVEPVREAQPPEASVELENKKSIGVKEI